ncbi:PilZ domain-containing protein [Marinobacter sp. C2H3]|uniref:PilZ domain-containing protein n=1 Tax=Marinobacter sp. C2H3 TaxID=3119003 RepID=UPI00300F2268
MEHRLSKRIPADLSLIVMKRGLPVAVGAVCNASRRGVFIATDYDDVGLNQVLELEPFTPDDSPREAPIRLKGQVVRKCREGIGLEFDGAENDIVGIAEFLHWLRTRAEGRPADADQYRILK